MQSVIQEKNWFRKKSEEQCVMKEIMESMYGKPTILQRISIKILVVGYIKKMKKEG